MAELVGQVPYSEFQARIEVRMDWATAATSDFFADLRAPLMAGTARPARRPMMEMTTRSSTRVKAAAKRRGIEVLSASGIPAGSVREVEGEKREEFLILDVGFIGRVEPCDLRGSRARGPWWMEGGKG